MPLAKKDIERYYLDRFKALCPDFPAGIVTSSEEPDFLIADGARTVGIEITELHRAPPSNGAPQQASEAMRHRVVTRAQTIYEAVGGPPIHCSLFFGERHISKNEVEPLASVIAKLAYRNLPAVNASLEEDYEWTNRAYFPDVLHTIHVHRLDKLTITHFSCPGFTWASTLTPADLDRRLAPKEKRCGHYLQRCDTVWLLLITATEVMSTWFNFNIDSLFAPVQSQFGKIFVLRHFAGTLHEITLTTSQPK